MRTSVVHDAQVAVAGGDPDEHRVLEWRRSTLARAGYGSRDATRLARAKDVDLHVAVDLLLRGCDVPTALRILL